MLQELFMSFVYEFNDEASDTSLKILELSSNRDVTPHGWARFLSDLTRSIVRLEKPISQTTVLMIMASMNSRNFCELALQ